MLSQRILTIAVAAPVFIFLLLSPLTALFFAFLLVLIMIAAYEWARLSGIDSMGCRLLYVFLFAIMGGIHFTFADMSGYLVLYGVTSCWWLAVACGLILYQYKQYTLTSRPAKLMMGLLTLWPPIIALYELHGSMQGPALVLFLFLLIWTVDIGAYVAGKLYGRIKLAPAISPGKTVEGLAGGLIAAVLLLYTASFYFNFVPLTVLAILGIITALISVVGDLYESLMKRWAGLKDSGSILPGHGGMLDRIDSVTAATPVFAFLYLYWANANGSGAL